ncbi:hypothetical protein BDV93DRAFT_546472 [Ceratobasidium sp. AG-I]|nr:hypothetical protein BDV93DRAFT_546472 [Ceratobasidium sp. AG-I]
MAARKRNNASDKGKGKALDKKRPRDGGNSDGDDISEPEPSQKRPRKETARKRDARQNDEEEQDARQEKRQATERRRQERSDERDAAMFVEDDNETERETALRTAALDLRAENARLEAELARARELSRRQHQQEQAGTSSTGASGSGTSASTDDDWPADDSIRPPVRISSVTMAEIRAHLGLSLSTDDAEWLRIRALFRDFMCMAALDFDIPWKQQDIVRLGNLFALIRERIPRFCRFANSWASELVVQDVFNHKRTHQLKLQRQKKNLETSRASKNSNDTQKEANSKETGQRSGASKSHHPPPSSSANDVSPPGSPSTPHRGRASPTGWPGSRAASPAGPHDDSHAAPGASPAESSPPPSGTRQPDGGPLQGGAGSTREHGSRIEAQDETVHASRQSGAGLSRGRNAGEGNEEAPKVTKRGGLRARAGLAAAALAAANGAAEDDDNARKGSGGSKKGAKAKVKPKPKAKNGKNEELFPDAGEEDDSDN